MGREWKQGYFIPTYPEKCINIKQGKNPFARSSWEFYMFNWCDKNANVIRWGSEIIKIPYIYDVEKVKGIHKTHMYYPDIYFEKLKNGVKEIHLIEIKPIKQKNKPIVPKLKTKKAIRNYYKALYEYVKNQNKWKYARMFCEGKCWKFGLLTENEIFKDIR